MLRADNPLVIPPPGDQLLVGYGQGYGLVPFFKILCLVGRLGLGLDSCVRCRHSGAILRHFYSLLLTELR